jgi:hypothetical protein
LEWESESTTPAWPKKSGLFFFFFFFLWLGSQLRNTSKVLLHFGVAVLVGPATHNLRFKKDCLTSFYLAYTAWLVCGASRRIKEKEKRK